MDPLANRMATILDELLRLGVPPDRLRPLAEWLDEKHPPRMPGAKRAADVLDEQTTRNQKWSKR